jgi:hypothetical protein
MNEPKSLKELLSDLERQIDPLRRLKSFAQTVVQLGEQGVRDEWELIKLRKSKQPLAVRRFIAHLMELDIRHRYIQYFREKNASEQKEASNV